MDYSTPVLGKPWSIPFEFPAYQYVSAKISTAFGLSEVEAGRWVSLLAFYLMLPGLVLLLRATGLSLMAAVLGVLPVLFAPVYLLYSRAVLIETTALGATVWFFAMLTKFRINRQTWQLVATLILGIVAVLVKSTTWAIACLPWAAWLVGDLWRARREGWRTFRVVADDVVLIGLPLLIVGFGWVWITDRIKEMNPIGAFLTSDKLIAFNFGTWAQRADPAVWKGLWSHWTSGVMPWWAFAAGAIALGWAPVKSRIVFTIGIMTFLLGQFVFIDLYWHHNYYFCATAVAACIAVGSVAGGLWDTGGILRSRRWVAVLLVGATCAGQFVAYRGNYFHVQVASNPGSTGLTDAIQHLTHPGEVVVMHSPFWSAETAFWSERRMLTIPDSDMFLHPAAVRGSIARLSDESVPLVIFSGESRFHPDWVIERIEDFDLEPVPLLTWANEAVVYAARSRYREMRAILKRDQFEGVALYTDRNAAELTPPIALAGTPDGDAMTNLNPVPQSGSLPYGVKFYGLDGKKQLLIHSPTELNFPIPPGAKQVELGYRMAPAVYEHKEFDGVDLLVEVREPSGKLVSLFKTRMLPDGDRTPHHVKIPLREHAQGTLVISSLPGPRNNSAFDWALLEYLRIR